MHILARVLCLALLFVQAVKADAGLEPVEDRIVSQVDSEHDRALALLEEAVNINSATMNLAGVRAVGEVFAREFLAMGFEATWIEGTGFGRAGHLIAARGEQGARLLLIGHLDTVFAPDNPFQKLEPLPDNRAKGPGTTDMKGGDVIIVQALRALEAVGALDRMSIRVVMTGDEENRGEPFVLANRALIEAATWADVAIGFEDGDGDPATAVVARRGSTTWQLGVSGTQAHSSQIFRSDIGDGAIFEAARILEGFRVALSGLPKLTFNPGVMVGGTDVGLDPDTSRGTAFGKENVIARIVLANGDIRALSPEQLDDAKATMRDIVGQHLPGTDATIEFTDKYPPMAPSVGNLELLEIYSQVSQALGAGPVTAVDPLNAGAADISFTAKHVQMALDGVGLMGTGGHTDEETADLATLPLQTKRAAILLYRLGSVSR
jgi:glutamate carboxypeptidase